MMCREVWLHFTFNYTFSETWVFMPSYTNIDKVAYSRTHLEQVVTRSWCLRSSGYMRHFGLSIDQISVHVMFRVAQLVLCKLESG